MRFTLLESLCFLVECVSIIQVGTGETTYYVSMLGRDVATLNNQTKPLHLIIINENNKDIEVAMTGSNNNTISTQTVPQPVATLTPYNVRLSCTGLIPSGIEIASKGLKLTSNDDFRLQVVQEDTSLGTPQRLEGYLALKSDQLGNEYYVSSYCVKGGWCQFSIVATEDTSLNVRFPSGVSANTSCFSRSGSSQSGGTAVPFYLNQLDILHIESQQDLSGTYISSSSPIAVIAGARNIPTADDDEGVHVMEQLLPINKWGKEFIVVPNDKNEIGDLINIVTKSDNTKVEILGVSPFVIPYAGGSVIRRIDWRMYTYVKTDKPVQMVQYMFIPLYESDLTSFPGMVLVPAKNQWTLESFFYGNPLYTDDKVLVSAASEKTLRWKGTNASPSVVIVSSAPEIERSGNVKAGFTNGTGLMKVYGGKAGAYGYISGNIATLGSIDLVDSEECEVRFGYPGDGIDNNCDDQVDEESCSWEDLETTFTMEYNTTHLGAPIPTKTIYIGATDIFYFQVQTCGLLQIGLRSSVDSTKFAALQVSQKYIQLRFCQPQCNVSDHVPVNGINNCETDKIKFRMELGAALKITVSGQTKKVSTPDLQIDRLLFMSIVRNSQVTMDVTEKDCGKIISETEDNYGVNFVISTVEVDTSHQLFLTNRNLTDSANVTITTEDPSIAPHTEIVPANDGVIVENSSIPLNSSYLRVTSTSEISVHYMYRTNGKSSAAMILPTDILGTEYHWHIDGNDEDKCFMVRVAENRPVFHKKDLIELIPESGYAINTSSVEGEFFESNTPFALFMGVKQFGIAHIPPKEMLGKHFYIPAIPLDDINATATITVITTEDSTYFRILGEYHKEYIKDYKGEVEERSLYQNEIFEIVANKPVQVELYIKSVNDSWGANLVIPHVHQYVTSTVLPKLTEQTFEFQRSFGIYKDGSDYNETIAWPQNATGSINNTMEFYLMVLVKDLSTDPHGYFILTSDLTFSSDTNIACKLTDGTPGDGLDNDCDNMNDEEECSSGHEDNDLDGDINEDCKAGIPAYVNHYPLLDLETNSTECPSPTNITTLTTPELAQQPSVVIHNQLNQDWYSKLVYPPPPAPPTLDPIQSTAPPATSAPPTSASTTTSTATPGTTVAPEETCMTDCLCPCGWVTKKNYTKEELNEIIRGIQEKLKLQKNKLSAVMRKKTSAPDDRPSAKAVGVAGVLFLIITIGSIVLLDVTSIIRDLRMLKTNLQEMRKKTSAADDRPSATAVGYAGLLFLIITIGSIVLLDVTSIIRDLRMLRTNLQEVFNI